MRGFFAGCTSEAAEAATEVSLSKIDAKTVKNQRSTHLFNRGLLCLSLGATQILPWLTVSHKELVQLVHLARRFCIGRNSQRETMTLGGFGTPRGFGRILQRETVTLECFGTTGDFGRILQRETVTLGKFGTPMDFGSMPEKRGMRRQCSKLHLSCSSC